MYYLYHYSIKMDEQYIMQPNESFFGTGNTAPPPTRKPKLAVTSG